MKHWPTKSLGDFVAKRSGSVDPAKFPDEIFDLYSIPAFDEGQPEIRAGKEIGSAKQVVESSDVLLSRIVPHIRRAWVVGANRGRRLIASGEWIVFRSPQVHPRFLRYFLVGDPFHSRFMQTVSGVGGSLLRAKASEVAKIELPVPPLAEQERIVNLLDEADKLRKLRAQADHRTAALIPALFQEMFGEPAKSNSSWPSVRIGDICEVKGGKRLPKGDEYSETPTLFRYIRVSDIHDGCVDEAALRFLKPETQHHISRYTVKAGDLIITIAGTIGAIAPVKASLGGANLTENAAKLVPRYADKYDTVFLSELMQTSFVQNQIDLRTGQVTIGKLALFRIKQISFPLPPLPLQKEIAQRVTNIRELKTDQATSYTRLDALFQSMLHRAFSGAL